MTNNTPNATSSATVSVPLATVLVVLLAVAKTQDLYGLGDLSWWWVFAPYWLGFALLLIILLVGGLIFGLFAGGAVILDKADAKKREKARQARLNKRA